MTGGLHAFCETGTEGIIWSVNQYGKYGYAALTPLQKGDVLTVFKNVTDGKVVWHDKLVFGNEPVVWGGQGGIKYPPAPRTFRSPQLWCHYALFRYPVAVMPS